MDHAMISCFLLGPTSEHSFTTLRRDGPCNGGHPSFHFPIALTSDDLSESQTRRSFRSRYPRGCVLALVQEMERTNPGDSVQYMEILH